MPTTIDTIRRLTIQGTSTGLDKIQADLKGISSAQDNVVQSSARLVSATASTDRSVLSAQAALDRYTKANDALANAVSKLERGQKAAGNVIAQGGTLTEANNRALANAKARVDELISATEKHTESLALNRWQQMELLHVSRSVFDELMAGVSPLRALAIEGGRLGQIFSFGSNGVGGTLKAVGGSILGLLSPTVLLTGGIVGLGAAATAAVVSYESGQEKLAASLEGVGRRAGATLAQLNAVAAAGASAGGLSTSQGTELAAGFAHAGIGGAQSQTLIADTRMFSRLSGTDVSTAGATLAGAFSDPAKGLDELDKQLGFVSGALRSNVQDLEAQGHLEEARTLAIDAFNKAMAGVTDTTWGASRAFDAVKNAVSNAFGIVGHRIDSAIFGEPRTKSDSQVEQERRQSLALQQSDLADAAVRSVLPDLVKASKAANTLGMLKTALSDPAILDNMKLLPGQTQRAYGNLAIESANASPALRQKQDYEIAMASADAFSVAEKAAVEARRAELAVLRETGDLTRAQAAAQMAVNEAIAKANSDADDRLGMAKQNHAMVGMTSYERGLAEIDNKYSGYGGLYSKDAAPGSALPEAVASDLKNAGDLLAQALRDVVAKIVAATSSPFGSLGGVPFGSGIVGMNSFADAIKKVESSGNYGALGPVTASGDRAYGAYQVMGANVPAWTKDALGFSMTPSQFLANKDAQDAVFNKQFAGSLTKYGNPNDAASVWFTGRPLSQGAGAHDNLGTTGAGYVGKFDAALSGAPLTVRSSANDNVAPVTSTALYSDQGAHALERADYIKTAQQGPIDDANRALDAQNRLLDVQYATLGKTKAQIEGAAAAQNLMNYYTTKHIDISPEMTASIKEIGDRAAETAQRTEDLQRAQQKLISSMDFVRSASRDALGTLISDLEQGKSLGKSLGDVMEGIGQKILGLGEDMLVSGLFGKTGTAGGGLFGNLLGGLFGSTAVSGGIGHNAGGTNDWRGGLTVVGERGPEIVNLPRGSRVIPNNMAFGPAAPSVSVTGGNVIIQGNATSDMIPQIKAYVDAKQAETHKHIERNLGSMQAAYNKRYAA